MYLMENTCNAIPNYVNFYTTIQDSNEYCQSYLLDVHLPYLNISFKLYFFFKVMPFFPMLISM